MSQPISKPSRSRLRPFLMVVLWPAFLMASAATGFVFSLIDPMELVVLDRRLQMPELGVYTVGFFVFWLLGMLSSGLTVWLMQKVP